MIEAIVNWKDMDWSVKWDGDPRTEPTINLVTFSQQIPVSEAFLAIRIKGFSIATTLLELVTKGGA
jgi:hypothetical protein